ncbi:MAG: GNAT family N-acetyltransferase [Actinobacteria bacterium]|nr:GNAT family N-acetyltransferase [Actinomycetota bacterium]MCL6104139.1 GNAT family N-acetyltransferase [Actinomycetota bacterium]
MSGSNSSLVEVKSATFSDIDELSVLYDMYRRELAAYKNAAMLFCCDTSELLVRRLNNPRWSIWVGIVQDAVVGFTMACYRTGHLFAADGSQTDDIKPTGDVSENTIGVIPELFVHPDARRVGIAELMLEQAARWLVDKGCQGVDVMTPPGNRAAKSFFERQDFKARLIVMYREL